MQENFHLVRAAFEKFDKVKRVDVIVCAYTFLNLPVDAVTFFFMISFNNRI